VKAPAAVLFLLILALATPCLAQVPAFLPEFQVNTADPDYITFNDVAMGQDGEFVVVWTENEANDDVKGRRFDAESAPLDDPFFVHAFTTNNQFASSVAKDGAGGFVAVWSDQNTGIRGRRYDADGTPIGGNFQVNTSTPVNTTYPHVACDPSGNFVVVWTSVSGTGEDVAARRFDSNGTPLGNEFTVNTFTAGNQSPSGVAMSPKGFVVSWGGEGSGTPNGIFAKLYDAQGTAITFDLHIHTAPLTNPDPRLPDVAMNAAGDFVVVWDDGDLSGYAVKGRRWTFVGIPAGGPFPISATSLHAYDPRVTSDSAGNFLVTWTSEAIPTLNLDGDGTGISGRLYDIGGFPVSPEFVVNELTTAYQFFSVPSMIDDGSFVVAWESSANGYGVKGRKSAVGAAAQIVMDPNIAISSAPSAFGNGVFEPGETLVIRTAWVNDTDASLPLTGTAPLLTGPAGPVYTINDGVASYGSIAAHQSASCIDGADCYSVTVSAPPTRPVQHWDAQLQETLSIGVPKTWALHMGESFPDVPTGHIFYSFIETLFHTGVTGGCAGGNYCPGSPVTRAQMAVFLLKSKFGPAHVPPPCTGTVFTDVPCTGGPFDPWIEQLAALQVTGGCGGGLYCPGNPVTRGQMAVFLLKTLEGSAYVPPACAVPLFDDVPCGSQFADWIGELSERAITGGCSVTPPLYCPTSPNNRGQMAVFLTKTFGLVLYGG
jgi:hypothetical protein